jgi:hypothetical protein
MHQAESTQSVLLVAGGHYTPCLPSLYLDEEAQHGVHMHHFVGRRTQQLHQALWFNVSRLGVLKPRALSGTFIQSKTLQRPFILPFMRLPFLLDYKPEKIESNNIYQKLFNRKPKLRHIKYKLDFQPQINIFALIAIFRKLNLNYSRNK